MVKYLSYATINGVNSLYLIINNINGYIEESNGNNVKKYGVKSEI